MRAIIDTNVIIDALADREPWNVAAQQIFLQAAESKYTGFITASSATDIYYILRKSFRDVKKTREVMSTLFSIFGILPVTEEDCIAALNSTMTDFEDAVMTQVAFSNRIDYIVTRNEKDFTEGKALSPDNFIRLL